jgi:hypothetical protein
MSGTVTPGELVLVCFVDRDPSRPAVFAHDTVDSPGALIAAVLPPSVLPGAVARVGDIVAVTSIGPTGGVIFSGSATVKAI